MKYFAITDVGLKRKVNQDAYTILENENKDHLFLVCDGIGGAKAGDVASKEVIDYFSKSFNKVKEFSIEEDILDFINSSVTRINKDINRLSKKYRQYAGMGTTLTGLLVTSIGTYSINVGDSRVYGFLDNKIFHLTKDHTLVNEMIEKGEISELEAKNHPKKHYLVKAIGVWEKVEADIHKVKDMDKYLICSDGLHGYLEEDEILNIINNNSNVEEKVNKLLEESLLKGGYDNITIIVVDING